MERSWGRGGRRKGGDGGQSKGLAGEGSDIGVFTTLFALIG